MDALTDEIGALLARMQAPAFRVGTNQLFEASSEDLGRAVVAQVERERTRAAGEGCDDK